MIVKVKKLREDAVIPAKAHPTDAGFDITAVEWKCDEDGNIVYKTGLAFEIPEGYAGFLFPRSSVAKKDQMLSNCVGVVDCHYRGEVLFKYKMIAPIKHDEYHIYKAGERVGQMIILPIPAIEMLESDDLNESDRGVGGYGSTGK